MNEEKEKATKNTDVDAVLPKMVTKLDLKIIEKLRQVDDRGSDQVNIEMLSS